MKCDSVLFLTMSDLRTWYRLTVKSLFAVLRILLSDILQNYKYYNFGKSYIFQLFGYFFCKVCKIDRFLHCTDDLERSARQHCHVQNVRLR